MVVHVSEEPESNIWYVDTSCSNHMCGNKSFFSHLNKSFNTVIRFGDSHTTRVIGKGILIFKPRMVLLKLFLTYFMLLS